MLESWLGHATPSLAFMLEVATDMLCLTSGPAEAMQASTTLHSHCLYNRKTHV